MKIISIKLAGMECDQDLAKALARQVAEKLNPETICISWHNSISKAQSSCCLGHMHGDRPAWEVYGEGHGGTVRIDVNDGEYSFVFS